MCIQYTELLGLSCEQIIIQKINICYLLQNRTNIKKKQKGRKQNVVDKFVTFHNLKFGKMILKTINYGKINSRQLVSMRQTINKVIKKHGKLKMNVFPQTQVTKKPVEVRMGKGKGSVDQWIVKLKSGTILCEIETVHTTLGLKALRLAQYKLPVNTKVFFN